MRVPNWNAIGPAVLEIWKRHPARAHVQNGSQLTFARHPTNRSLNMYRISAQSVQPFSRCGIEPWTCARAAAPQLWHMDSIGYTHVSAYLHPKFQRNRPTTYQDIAIVTKLTPLRFARGTCTRGHPHASRKVQYLGEGMKLPCKYYRM